VGLSVAILLVLVGVRSALRACSLSRGSGDMPPPRKILKNKCYEIESEGNFN